MGSRVYDGLARVLCSLYGFCVLIFVDPLQVCLYSATYVP